MAGVHDIVIACGVESMSRVPMGSARMDRNPFGPSSHGALRPGLVSQGVSAELVAATLGALARGAGRATPRARTSARAAAAAGGHFAREIVPIRTAAGTVERDETHPAGHARPRSWPSSSPRSRRSAARPLPGDPDWRITAGNSSQMTDGAAAVLLMSERGRGHASA